jgi:hypothetical protein
MDEYIIYSDYENKYNFTITTPVSNEYTFSVTSSIYSDSSPNWILYKNYWLEQTLNWDGVDG